MQLKKLDYNINPRDTDLVRVKEMGNITELMWTNKNNANIKIQKISKDQYIYLETGEVLEFDKNLTRADDKNNVRVTLNNLRDILNTNVQDLANCRWLTLTYSENMTDHTKITSHFRKFNARCRELYGDFEYIAIREPQGRGAWHLHVVLIFPSKAPYMDNKVVRERLWKKGFITITKLDSVTNVGAYLTAYLTDMELDDVIKNKDLSTLKGETIKEITIEENGNTETKRYIKGARLSMYPVGMNIYSCSKKIKKPNVLKIPEFRAKKIVSDSTLTFERTNKIEFENTSKIINYRYYTITEIKSKGELHNENKN